MKNKFYITTTLPYVNADPHIGFAKEIVEADVLSRFHRAIGDEVFFNTGVDEHGLKILRKAEESGMDPQEYCDQKAPEFDKLKQALNLSYDKFIRTTDPRHIAAAQEFWKLCDKNGDIYKKNYKVKYCVGCELEKTDSELVDGKCPLHPNAELEIIDEENYFFKFSSYQDKLLEFYENNSDFVLPKKRLNEIKSFVERGLEDFSISRLKSKMSWGVPVPGDSDHVMYVWFDALVNYISTLGWPDVSGNYEKFWPGVQVCGKDNLRQQAAMWQAMLFSAGLPNSKQVFVNGFITVNGQKMSKSLGNVISPLEMVEKFGVDGTRYLLLAGSGFGEDFDITWEKMIEKYNADLANGIGNLTSRVITLYDKVNVKYNLNKNYNLYYSEHHELTKYFESCQLSFVIDEIMSRVRDLDREIGNAEPWKSIKTDVAKFQEDMGNFVNKLNEIAFKLAPFMPETSEKIKKALETKKVEPLFQRIK
ncbi:MAG: methionyl-tRNA synthetase [Patescibacteria group bacterium]|nr:methionyl-tRNA synthetase [Patescibacteria group bacterium]